MVIVRELGGDTSIRSGTVAMVAWSLEEGWVGTLPYKVVQLLWWHGPLRRDGWGHFHTKWYSCYGDMVLEKGWVGTLPYEVV